MNLKDFTKPQKPQRPLLITNFVLLAVLIISLGFNQMNINKIYQSLGIKQNSWQKVVAAFTVKGNNLNLTGDPTQDAIKLAISSGLPAVYGSELGISFDQVQPALDVMKQYDPTYGRQKITLAGNDLQRFVNVGLKISCEYCCGAVSIINQSGQAACGCAHSQAMRGLLAYLIQNHGAEYSDDELLKELALWKAMYFPKQMIQKLANQLQGLEEFTPDTAALVLGAKLPDYGQGGKSAPLPSEVQNLPSMVGGC